MSKRFPVSAGRFPKMHGSAKQNEAGERASIDDVVKPHGREILSLIYKSWVVPTVNKLLLCFTLSSIVITSLAIIDVTHQNTVTAHTLFGYIQDDTPLTLSQIEDLIKNAPDNAIAIEIERRGIAFQLTAGRLASLKRLNAGPKTIRALLNKGRKPQINKRQRTGKQREAQATINNPNKITILVADFDGPDSNRYRVTERIIQQLRIAANDFHPDLNIQALAQPITEQQGSTVAHDIGIKHHASIVLWGYYGATSEKVDVNIYFEVLRAPKILPLRRNLEAYTLPISELEGFKIQTRLSSEMTYLALLAIGLARFEAGDYDGCITRLTKALSQDDVPDQIIDPAGIYFYRGFAYDLKAEPTAKGQAAAGYDNTIADKAIADYDRAIEIRPNYVWAYVNRGTVYSNKEQYDSAIASYDQAIELDPNLPQAYYHRGYTYRSMAQYDRAIADYSKAIDIAPAYPWTYVLRGDAYRNMGQHDRAFADFEHAIRLDPKDANAYQIRGLNYLFNGQFDRAIADYSAAIKLDPNNAEAYANRGSAYSNKKQYDRAIADYVRAINLDQTYAEAYSRLGTAYADKGQHDRAIKNYSIAIKLDPTHSPAYNNRALAYMKMGNTDQAISDFNRILQITDVPSFLRQFAEQKLRELGAR